MQVENYKQRWGHYPESVHADQIYRNRANRKFCKDNGIRLSGPPLGRPRKITDANRELQAELKKQARQDEIDRIPVEGTFGVAKRRYSLNNVMAKLAPTAESTIAITFLVMNLEKWRRQLLSLCSFLCLMSIKSYNWDLSLSFSKVRQVYKATIMLLDLYNGKQNQAT